MHGLATRFVTGIESLLFFHQPLIKSAPSVACSTKTLIQSTVGLRISASIFKIQLKDALFTPALTALPNPFSSTVITCAPADEATFEVLSVEPLSTTITYPIKGEFSIHFTKLETVDSSLRAGITTLILSSLLEKNLSIIPSYRYF